MNSNTRANKAFIEQYRKELRALSEDISKVDEKVLNQSVMVGERVAKESTPVGDHPSEVNFITKDGKNVSFRVAKIPGGHLKRSWFTSPIKSIAGGIEKELYNNVDYGPHVNYGHRVKNKDGVVVGFVKGKFMLEKAIGEVNKQIKIRFKKELERVKKIHDA